MRDKRAGGDRIYFMKLGWADGLGLAGLGMIFVVE